MTMLTAVAFASAKTVAWIERYAARPYDLWALGEHRCINPVADELLAPKDLLIRSDRRAQVVGGRGSLSLLGRVVRRPPADGLRARRSCWRACPSLIWPGRGLHCRAARKHRRDLLLSRTPCP